MLKVDLLREPKLFFQIFDQLLEALSGDGVVSQGSRPLGLLQPPLKFLSVALFNHGDTLLSIRRGSGAMVHSFSVSFLLKAERANLSVKLPKLNVMIDSQQLGHFNRLGVIKGCARLLIMVAGFNRLPKPLHREFDVRRLQVTPAFNLCLISVFGER